MLLFQNPSAIQALLSQITNPMGGENAQYGPMQGAMPAPPPRQPSLLDMPVTGGGPGNGTPFEPSPITPLLPFLTPEQRAASRPSLLDRFSSFRARWADPTAPTAEQIAENRALGFTKANEYARQLAAQQQAAERATEYRTAMSRLDLNDPDYLRKAYTIATAFGQSDPNKIGETAKDLRVPEKGVVPVGQPGTGYVQDGVLHIVPGEKLPEARDFSYWKTKDGNYVPVRAGETPPPGAVPQSTAQTMITVAGANDRAASALSNAKVKAFSGEVKPLADRAAVIEQAILTMEDAAHNPNPAVRRSLYSSAIANFVQAADQKAQLRYQMLQFFKNNVDPSIGGRWDILKDRLLKGELPQYSMDAMLQHLGNLKQLVGNEIETKRADLVRRHPSLDSELPYTESYFSSGWAPGGAKPKADGGKPMSAAAYKAAKAAGYSDEDIRAQGYKIPQ